MSTLTVAGCGRRTAKQLEKSEKELEYISQKQNNTKAKSEEKRQIKRNVRNATKNR